jgi:hypothetical protein
MTYPISLSFPAAGLSLIFCAGLGLAQQAVTPARTRVPVTVVLSKEPLGPDIPFLIKRQAGAKPRDVIVMSPGSNPGQLSDAIRTLMEVRELSGDLPATNATMRMRPQQHHKTQLTSLPWTPRVLNDLKGAKFKTVVGVGKVRTVDIWLPRQQPEKELHRISQSKR